MSQRSHNLHSSRSSRVFGNYIASQPSLGVASQARPQQTGDLIDLTNDDSEFEVRQQRLKKPQRKPKPNSNPKEPAQGPRLPTQMIDLTTPSRSPSPRNRPTASKPAPQESVPRVQSPLARSSQLPPLNRDSSPEERARSSLPPLSRDSSPDGRAHSRLPSLSRNSSPEEQGRKVRERASAVKHVSSPRIKISPQSLQNQREQDQRKENSATRRQTSRQKPRPSTPQLSEEDNDEDEDGPLSRILQPSPGTPSKQGSSRGHQRSQKSTDFSIGSSSPLTTRLKQRKNSKQINDTPKARSQSPREVMSRRSISNEHASPKEPLTKEDLETALEEFESRLSEEHAFGMRWLLQDVRETVTVRRSAFFEAPFVETGNDSPWTSNPRKQVRPGSSSGVATHIDKMDSFVS